MRPPHLNRRLTLEAPQRAADGAGGYTEGWIQLGVVWAEVKPRTGRERLDGAAATSVMAHRITVRSAPQGSPSRPQPEQRFRDGGRLFQITAVTELDRQGLYLSCFATEEIAV